MFFLRQLFRARETIFPPTDREMGVLDHLEDLRRTILKIAAALVLSMIFCFGFAPSMMGILRRPADNVWTQHETSRLPKGIKAADWIAAKSLAAVRRDLPPQPRAQLDAAFPPAVRQLAETVPLLQAASILPQDKQDAYLSAADAPEKTRELAMALHASHAELKEGQGRAALKLMGAFQPGEAFMLSLQLSFFGGLIISFPLLTYFLLQFIAPGLLEHEKRLLYKSVSIGFFLFLAGCSFAYFIVLPRVLGFFYAYSLDMGIENDWRIGYYLTFAAKLVFVFGIIFEMPVITIPLIKLGILRHSLMKRTRSYALVACFAAALFLAPAPDPGTMLAMALPMYALYELCILFAWKESRKRQRESPHATGKGCPSPPLML